MEFIDHPFVTDFEVLGSNNGKKYEKIVSYKNLDHQNELILFEYQQQHFYNRIRVNFLKDNYNLVSGSMRELDIFGIYLRISNPSCLYIVYSSIISFNTFIPIILL